MSTSPETTISPIINSPDCVVYCDYDVDAPPAHPGQPWTRFVCISDTHGHTFQVPDGDVLLHAGDLCRFGNDEQLRTTAEWLCALPHRIKIVIAGNHDSSLDDQARRNAMLHRREDELAELRDLYEGADARAAGLVYLEYTWTEFQARDGGRIWKVYGSPGSLNYGGMAFTYDPGAEAEHLVSRIPHDVDILLTHGPAYGILDLTNSNENAGCISLRNGLEGELRPLLHVCGHIHEGYGVEIRRFLPEDDEDTGSWTLHVNASNFPSGKRAAQLRERGLPRRVGGSNFQPIIVDILDGMV